MVAHQTAAVFHNFVLTSDTANAIQAECSYRTLQTVRHLTLIIDGAKASKWVAGCSALLKAACCSRVEQVKLQIRFPAVYKNSPFSHALLDDILPAIVRVCGTRTLEFSLHFQFDFHASDLSPVEAVALITDICSYIGSAQVVSVTLHNPPASADAFEARPLRVACPNLKYSEIRSKVPRLRDVSQWLHYVACNETSFDVSLSDEADADEVNDAAAVLTPLLTICKTVKLQQWPKLVLSVAITPLIAIEHLECACLWYHCLPEWSNLQHLTGNALRSLRMSADSDDVVQGLASHLTTGKLPNLDKLYIDQAGTMDQDEFYAPYKTLVTIFKQRRGDFQCALSLALTEGHHDELSRLLRVLREALVELSLTFNAPTRVDFAMQFPRLRSLALNNEFVFSLADCTDWQDEHSLARIISEISAPSLRDLDMQLYQMDRRYLGMLQCILSGGAYSDVQLAKFPELVTCCTSHRREYDSPRMKEALAELVEGAQRRGEIQYSMMSYIGAQRP